MLVRVAQSIVMLDSFAQEAKISAHGPHAQIAMGLKKYHLED
jgi:hypothetical protein